MTLLYKKISIIICFNLLILSLISSANKIGVYNPHVPSILNSISYINNNSISIGEDTTTYSQLDIDQLADSLTQKVLSENRIVDLIDPEKVYKLPIGIGKNIGGVYYIVVLDDLRFTPTGLTAKAYMSLSFPGSSQKIGLVADNVKIGIGGIQSAQLKMLNDKPIELSGGNSLIVDADSTFIEWDCNGYKSTQLSAKLELDPSVFFKENPANRAVIDGARVSGRIQCSVVDFNDILLNVSLDPFQVKGLKDFSFYPKDIILDMSDTRNDESMQFPSGYKSALFDGENKNLWRGLYIKTFALKFPKAFAKNGSLPEVSISRFLIDIEGITGNMNLNYPLITLEQGNIGGWKFSVNSLSVSLCKNEIAGFGMTGGIVLPITEQNKPLNYKASIDANKNFMFQVTLPGNMNTPLFGSNSSVNINSNSTITVESRNGEFYPKAVLHGNMKIGVGGSSGASLANITFQGLTIQREDPQVDIQSLSMQSGVMAGFPIQVNEIKVLKDKRDLGLLFDVSANLMSGKIEGGTSFIVWATNKDGNWQYKDLEFRKILVDANTGSISLRGELVKYKNDAVYGDGYFGSVNMSVIPGLAVSATAQFGNISGDRYWYADASAIFSSGITIFSGFAIYGFGGGAYYHMQRNVPTNVLMENKTDSPQAGVPGKAYSGITYVPNKNIALGFNAKVIVGTQPSPKAFNGSVTFGLEFTSSFGLSRVYFEGDGRFMTEETSNGSDSKVRATISIDYLVEQKELSGFADAYINVGNAIKGGGANNLAGRVEFYFAKSKWHIYVGSPTNPVCVKLMNTLRATSYFMVGTELPDFPSLPANVASLSSKVNFTNMRSESLARSGGGFAFGASIMASTGEKKFLIFYGKFELGAGFDLMLKNFGNEARCEGFSEPLGINGWYAQGQAWAYVDAKIGVRVKIFLKERKFTIIEAGFAAALGAQLPNPTYLAGACEAYFSVLGGLVKGNCHFEFDYGTQCKLVNANAVEGISVIAQLTPDNASKDVDVFLTPQVAFNMPINQPFSILDTDGKTKSFRVALDYFKIMSMGSVVSSTSEWNSNHDALALRSSEALPSQSAMNVSVKVHFEIQGSNGEWTAYIVDGKVEGEERSVSFTTGVAPDYITEGNVKYTYPVKNMVNFFKQEYGKCFIQVNTGVNYLFTKEGNWKYIARFKSGETILNMPLTYSKENKRVEFDVPASLTNTTIYQMRVLRVPGEKSASAIDRNVHKREKGISSEQTVTTKEIEGTLSEEGVTELYSLHFRTSSFNTFVEKMKSFRAEMAQRNVTDGIEQLALFLYDSELFDKYEIDNIIVEAILDDNYWYKKNYKDLIYSNYPIQKDVVIDWRKLPGVGLPPTIIGSIYQDTNPISLTESNIATGSIRFEKQVDLRIEYDLCYYVSQDFCNIKSKSFQYTYIPALRSIANFTFKSLTPDKDHYFKLKYYVPGISAPTSEYKTFITYD